MNKKQVEYLIRHQAVIVLPSIEEFEGFVDIADIQPTRGIKNITASGIQVIFITGGIKTLEKFLK